MTQIQGQPDIFQFHDYREYLRHQYAYHKRSTPNFSYRSFSTAAGFKSPNFLKLIAEGKRNLTLKSASKVARAFKLNEEETKFFRHLVLLNQAKSPHEKRKHISDLLQVETFRKMQPLKVAQYELYRRWYTVAIREMIGAEGFMENPEWIAQQLVTPVKPEDVEVSLDSLIKIGLIERAPNDKLLQVSKNLTTGNEVESSTIADYHKKMIELGAGSIDLFQRHEREISASTLLLSEGAFQKIKAMIQDFRRSLLTVAEEDQAPQKAVYQFNFQAFPLTKPIEDEFELEQRKPA